ncbi:MAG: isoprenyl transferase [Verrucomicrobiota bacterium]
MIKLDPDRPVPEHVAIIMDGNGRWAKSRQLPRAEGHRAGAESVETAIETCGELGVHYLTLYAFSSENWRRPKTEVTALMRLLSHFLKAKTESLIRNNVKLQIIGEISKLPDRNRRELDRSIAATAHCDGLTLIVALSYGAREEILSATKDLMRKAADKAVDPDELDESLFAAHLFTADYPDPDLLIRTSGEYRISNFLLWQISYAEIYVTDTFWPDFRREHLIEAIANFQQRNRRFGGL